jgi:HAD superfamily hydrolase (TIGR01509 family)
MPMEKARLAATGVIFDLDGTLIDSFPAMLKMLDIAFERLKIPRVSRESALDAAKEGHFEWNRVLPPVKEAQKEDLITRAAQILAEIQPQIMRREARLIPGAEHVLEEISRGGMRIGLVTATRKRFLGDKLYHFRETGVHHLFEAVIAVDDVPCRKPAPDPLIECAKRLGVPLDETVYVGDSRVDIRAGKAAGTWTIGVLTGLDDHETLALEAPDRIIESVAELERTLLFKDAAGLSR